MIAKGYKVYSYSGGNIITCQVGTFHEFKDIDSLFRINRIAVFFVPKGVELPK